MWAQRGESGCVTVRVNLLGSGGLCGVRGWEGVYVLKGVGGCRVGVCMLEQGCG